MRPMEGVYARLYEACEDRGQRTGGGVPEGTVGPRGLPRAAVDEPQTHPQRTVMRKTAQRAPVGRMRRGLVPGAPLRHREQRPIGPAAGPDRAQACKRVRGGGGLPAAQIDLRQQHGRGQRLGMPLQGRAQYVMGFAQARPLKVEGGEQKRGGQGLGIQAQGHLAGRARLTGVSGLQGLHRVPVRRLRPFEGGQRRAAPGDRRPL